MAAKTLLGILGGTFDPIHLGHLRLATELAEITAINTVHFIPTYQPAHRHAPEASSEARFAMVKAAVQDNPRFIADDRELRRQDASYTIDTLIDLEREFEGVGLCLFLGCDAFLEFLTWHRYQEILERAHLIIAKRPMFELPRSGPILEVINTHQVDNIKYIHQHKSGGIFFAQTTLLGISATDIRKQIAIGQDPRYLLHDHVYDYIKLNGTYQK